MVENSSDHRFVFGAVLPVLAAALLAALTFGSSAAVAAPVGAPIEAFSTTISTSQAGAHPDLTVDFTVGTRTEPPLLECGCNEIKNGLLETPAGFVGNTHAVPECTLSQFLLNECSPDSVVGRAEPTVVLDGCCLYPGPTSIYNLVPEPGQAGLLAWKAPIAAFPVYIVIGARTGGDYGLNSEVKGITATFGLKTYHQVLWGVPASPIHDSERGAASNSPEKPFLSNPTTCSGPLTSNFVSMAYDHGRDEKTAPWPAVTGCDQLNFNPSLSAKPTTESADSASGLDVVLKHPLNESPVTPTDSEIKATTVTLPPGFSLNSSAADGKTSCSDAQARFGTEEEAQCPEFSKIGIFTVDATGLPKPISGGIYLGEPLPGDRYRTFLTADGYGTHLKLPGSTYPDPVTGQLTTKFENLPQQPYSGYTLHYFGSERGLLATPSQCGTYAVNSEFVPWDEVLPNQTSIQFFKVTSGPGGSPCPGATRPFTPGFKASGQSNGAGAHSPLSITITRADGDQTLSTIGVHTPPGFSATLKGIPYCPDATLNAIASSSYSGVSELNNPKCPAASQVGVSSAAAGAGSKPFNAPGRVYLAGPYKGAPVSFAVVTPAVSGPYDLGNVVNRTAVEVDPVTAEVTATSDPLPQIIEGIPLRLRSVLINLDRKDFTLNPTNCDPFEVNSALTGDQGALATPASHFQVANCDNLDFEPKLKIALSGPTKRSGNPALKATLTQDVGNQANIARAVVTLPHSEFLDQAHIKTLCTRVQFAANACPANSIYGTARAISPILDQPLEGPVYLRSSSNPLPDLVAALKGPAYQPLEVDLVGKIDSVNGGIRTTFDTVPDAPVSKFVLSMQGGKKGLLENSRNLCKSTNRIDARIAGQNGAKANQRPVLEAPCGNARKKRAAKKKRAAERRAAAKSRRAGR